MKVRLVMFTESGERRDFEIRRGKTTIGRNSECGVQVKLGVVSRRHCQIIVKESKVKVRDLGSSNGTYVNNRRVQEVTIGAGETLTVGPVIFTVVIDGMPAEIRPVRTIVEGEHGKPSKKTPNEAAAEALEGTESVDLDESGEMELAEEEEGDESDNPLAQLEEISKQHGKTR
jgi:pSer/pThr/pTyr-binding forkhead associated (FHA) protein